MPARNKVFTEFQRPPYRSRKNIRTTNKRKMSPIIENRPKRELHRYGTYLIIVLVTLFVIIGICLAVLLPILITGITRASPSTSTGNSIDTDNSTVNNSTTTTLSSVTSTLSSSSTSSSATAVTTGVPVTTGVAVTAVSTLTTSLSVNGYTVIGIGNCSADPYYCGEHLTISCSADLINMTILIITQKTVNATYNTGTYTSFWGGTVNQTYVDSGTEIIYTWTIVPGQMIHASGSPYNIEAQFHLSGIIQPTSVDTYSLSATTVTGISSTVSGHF